MVDLFQPEREKQKQKPLLNPPWHWTYSLRVAHVAALLQQFLVLKISLGENHLWLFQVISGGNLALSSCNVLMLVLQV